MPARRKKAEPAPPDPAPEIDWELTEMLNEGIDSLEKHGPVPAEEVRRILAEDFARWEAERKAKRRKR
jgi:hypothetical protein